MRIVVSAGPTREHLDAVRFLSNPSTGRMGFAVARAAKAVGHEVVLVAGPVALRTPAGVERRDVVSALDMLEAVLDEIGKADALVMTAAVADWRPARRASGKLKKAAMDGTLRLVRNPDILREVARRVSGLRRRPILVGFAAETGAPDAEAVRKCREKGLDLVLGNDVSEPGCGFGTRTNRVSWATPDGTVLHPPLLSKDAIARRIVRFLERRVAGG